MLHFCGLHDQILRHLRIVTATKFSFQSYRLHNTKRLLQLLFPSLATIQRCCFIFSENNGQVLTFIHIVFHQVLFLMYHIHKAMSSAFTFPFAATEQRRFNFGNFGPIWLKNVLLPVWHPSSVSAKLKKRSSKTFLNCSLKRIKCQTYPCFAITMLCCTVSGRSQIVMNFSK